METKELTTKEIVNLFLAQPNQENFDQLSYSYVCLPLAYYQLSDKTILTNFFTEFAEMHSFKFGFHKYVGEVKNSIAKRFFSLASSSEDYTYLYYYADEPILKQDIYDKIDLFELPVEQWIKLYKTYTNDNKCQSEDDKTLQKLFKNKICALTKNTNDWINVYELSQKHNYPKKIQKFIAKNLIKSLENYEEGGEVFELIRHDNNIRSNKLIILYFQKIYELSNTLDEYLFVYSFINDFWKLKKSVKDDRASIKLNAYQKIISMAKTFEDWDEIYFQVSGASGEEKMEALALQKMTELF